MQVYGGLIDAHGNNANFYLDAAGKRAYWMWGGHGASANYAGMGLAVTQNGTKVTLSGKCYTTQNGKQETMTLMFDSSVGPFGSAAIDVDVQGAPIYVCPDTPCYYSRVIP